MGAKAKIDERSLGWNSEKVSPGLLGLWKIRSRRWKNELYEGSEELRKLTAERRKAEAEELRVCNTSRVGLEEEGRCQTPIALKVKLDPTQQQDGGTPGELGVGVDWRASEGEVL